MDVPVVKARSRRDAPHRRGIVGVMGSGDDSFAAHLHLAVQVGRWIAHQGWHLLTGGGGGMMAAVSQAFFETPGRGGLVIGVVPGFVSALDRLETRAADLDQPIEYRVDPDYPNPWVELVIYTHLPLVGPQGTWKLSRNHLNVLSSDVVVALPGREGTFSELWLAWQYGIPAIAYHPTGLDSRVPAGVPRVTEFDEVARFVRASVPSPPLE